MSVTLFLANIDAQADMRRNISDFMGDMYATDEAIKIIIDEYDLAFLAKSTAHINALLDDAKDTYKIEIQREERVLDQVEFVDIVKEYSEGCEDEERRIFQFFSGAFA